MKKLTGQREIAEKEEAEERRRQEAKAREHDEMIKRIEHMRPEDIVFEHRHSSDNNAADRSGNSESSDSDKNGNNK